MNQYTTEEARIEGLIARERANTCDGPAGSVSTLPHSRSTTHASSYRILEGDPTHDPLTQSPSSFPIDLSTDFVPESVHHGHVPRGYGVPDHHTLSGLQQVQLPGFHNRADSLRHPQRSYTDSSIDSMQSSPNILFTFENSGPAQPVLGSSPPVWPAGLSGREVTSTLASIEHQPTSDAVTPSSSGSLSSPILERLRRQTGSRPAAAGRRRNNLRHTPPRDSIPPRSAGIQRSVPRGRRRIAELPDISSEIEQLSVDELMERESRIGARDDILLAEAIAPQVDIEAQDDWITRRFIMYCRGAPSITLNLGFEEHVTDFAINRKPYTEDIINEYVNHAKRHRRAWYADWQRSVNLDEAKPCMTCFRDRGKFRCGGQGHVCTTGI
jgi:hypothetical protein